MKNTVVSLTLILIACAVLNGQSPVDTKPHDRNKSIAAVWSKLSPPERLAWTQIQDRIDRMSHGEEAKDVPASIHFMSKDYALHTLPDPQAPNGKVISLNEIAVYKKQNLDSLFSTSPETRTDIEALSMKGTVATVIVYQFYVRTIRGGDGSPHEARTSVRHSEDWMYTDRGWLQKTVRELQRGPVYLDGELFNPGKQSN
jgi:hypothetical protein